MRRRNSFWFGLALAASTLAGGSVVASGQWLTEPPIVPNVDLADQDGRTVRLDELMRGRTVLVNFMFTGCASVCPPQTAILRAAREMLASDSKMLLVSVTVDPLGDGPLQLRDYAKRYELKPGLDKGWVFLTGQPQQVRRVMASFGERGNSPEGHAGLVWIGNPANKRWTRVAATNGPDVLVRLMREAAQ